MKKFLLFFFLIFVTFQAVSVTESFAAERTVKASLPAFRVQINGVTVNSKTSEYPLLVYKNITYMPMTYDYCNLLGLESNWTKEEGLVISLRNNNFIPTITEGSSKYNNASWMTATITDAPITLNNRKIDNSKEPYPFLRYKDITYFPLTFQFLKEEFNIYTNFLPDAGLAVYSENKYFYKYYAEGSELQSTDLRISSILYLMAAITISDGTEKYPANNVRQYRYEYPGVTISPDFKDVKYYGYLPDGSGGLKANTDSKLHIGELVTTEISSLENPEPVQVELGFHQYYGEQKK
jgi:hypothetical protein